jgi:hypothetical protein
LLLLATAGLLSLATVSAVEQEGRGVAPEQIKSWIEQLDAREYAKREEATRALVAAGRAAVRPLQTALQQGSWETTTRGIFVLQELALAADAETEEAAFKALEQISSDAAPGSRRASEVLSKLIHLRQQRALEVLTQLGARFDPLHEERDLLEGPIRLIEFGSTWRGQETDLRRLRWLRDIEQVTFLGRQVSDQWLQHLRGMERLLVLKIKDAQLTDAASATLPQLTTVRKIKLLYVPLGDRSVPHLKACRQLTTLKLYGTRVTMDGANALASELGDRVVDYRRGAFLGVSPANNDFGPHWCIGSVIENSAAEKAGLKPGDVITKYDNQLVTDFEMLMKMIGQNNVSDHVEIEIVRDGETLVKEIQFGAWD